MGWFEFGRDEKYPTQYFQQLTAAHTDVLTTGIILAFVILAISLFTLLPALSGRKLWIYFGRVFCSLLIGGIVVLGNYGHQWEVGHVEIRTPYKGGTDVEIEGSLGLHISLRGINITLKGDPKDAHARKVLFKDETIDYNEHFSWEWEQGRFGFGYYAARIAREYRAAVYRGIPLPILQVAEYFTFDGEGIRFGRHYRQAGYYSHIMMWCAFPSWLIANILLFVLVRYAAMFLTATGVFQLIAISIWTHVRNFVELQVPFESKTHGEVVLKTHFGPDYYLVLVNGILCVILGVVILLFDAFLPDQVCQFFGIDPLTTYDEYHLTRAEFDKQKREKAVGIGEQNAMEQGYGYDPSGPSAGPSRRNQNEGQSETSVVWKRRTGHNKLLQSFKLKERPKKKPSAPTLPPRPIHETVHEIAEMSVRTPLLRQPEPKTPISSDEDDFSDYANFPPPLSEYPSATRRKH